MKEVGLDWATYILDLCDSPQDAERARRRWTEKADAVPGAEVRVVRLQLHDGTELYYIATQSRELVPPALLRFHQDVASGMDGEKAAWRLIRRTGYGYSWPGDPGPPVVVDLTSPTFHEKAAFTEEV